VAVDANGNVYVVDITDRVHKFTPDGSRVASFGASGSGAGEMRVPVSIAVDDDGNLYVTEDTPNHRVQKFAPVSGTEAAIARDTSAKAGPGAAATIAADTAKTAAVGVLEDQAAGSGAQSGVMPAAIANGPAIGNYVGTEVDANGYRRIKMWIGPNGNVIPTGDWRDAHPGYCSGADQAMKGAVNLVNIKVYPVADSYFAFAQYIDVATGEILEQREGQDADLQDAIDQAWNNLNTPIGAASSPCKKVAPDVRFRFKTKFSEELTLPTAGYVRTDKQEIVASDRLTYDPQTSQFEGSAELRWKTYYLDTSGGGFAYVECTAPATGRVEITFPAGQDGQPLVSGNAEIDFVNVTNPDCANKNDIQTLLDDQLLHELPFYWEQHHEQEYDQTTGTFTIADWEPVPSVDSIVAQKAYDFTDTFNGVEGTLVYTETTTIQILE
jgi:hypothetical protein